MKKLLFSGYVVLAILGCGGAQGELPDVFANSNSSNSSLSSSSNAYSSSSLSSSSNAYSSSSLSSSSNTYSSSSLSSSSNAYSSSSLSSSSNTYSSSSLSSSSNLSGSSSSGIVYGPSVEYGGKTYKTIIIDNQTWFQQDLEYEGTWETAMTVCPSGWHLPTVEDWYVLMHSVDPSCEEPHDGLVDGYIASATAGSGLKTYGFEAGEWWSATGNKEYDDFAYNWSMYSENNAITWYDNDKSNSFSVRCLKNND